MLHLGFKALVVAGQETKLRFWFETFATLGARSYNAIQVGSAVEHGALDDCSTWLTHLYGLQ